ncbi:MAG: hypothetical protein WDN09_04030 [bacterium]
MTLCYFLTVFVVSFLSLQFAGFTTDDPVRWFSDAYGRFMFIAYVPFFALAFYLIFFSGLAEYRRIFRLVRQLIRDREGQRIVIAVANPRQSASDRLRLSEEISFLEDCLMELRGRRPLSFWKNIFSTWKFPAA